MCSRWTHATRSYAEGVHWDWLRNRMLELILAKVGSASEREVVSSDEDLQAQLRALWKEWLEATDLGEPDLLHVAPGQPLHLRLIRALPEAVGTPTRTSSAVQRRGYPWKFGSRYLGHPTSSRSS